VNGQTWGLGAYLSHGRWRLAGADIREQKELDFVRAYNTDYLKNLNDGIVAIHKPVIGAINGYAVSFPFKSMTRFSG
jgi:enoyl-CoA hydratase/carnithine racemase